MPDAPAKCNEKPRRPEPPPPVRLAGPGGMCYKRRPSRPGPGTAGKTRGMKNFLRALRCAWPYRVRLGVSVFCAVLAAVFWGLNFTAIYPVLKIIGSDKNLQQWCDTEIVRV